MFPDEYTCQHHTDDVRNTQLTHHNRGKQDDEQYDKENQRRTRYREILHEVQHFGGKVTK